MFLDSLLNKAVASDEAYDKVGKCASRADDADDPQYATVCTAFLSKPLDISVPAASSVFLNKVLARAVAKPSSDTIRPIYLILSGLGCSGVWASSQTLLVRLQEELKQILNCRRDYEDQLSTLLCLAVFARLASAQLFASDGRRDSSCLSTPGISDEGLQNRLIIAQKFFGPQRASKTLDLTVASARILCSQSCVATLDSIIEGLSLCREIVKSVAIVDKRKWLTNRTSMSKAPIDGILRSDLDHSVQSAVCNFYLAF